MESAVKAGSGRKIPGRTGKSTLRQRRAGPTVCQLNDIPKQLVCRICCSQGYLLVVLKHVWYAETVLVKRTTLSCSKTSSMQKLF